MGPPDPRSPPVTTPCRLRHCIRSSPSIHGGSIKTADTRLEEVENLLRATPFRRVYWRRKKARAELIWPLQATQK
ncbi:MAG: hypothetical protein CL936_16390 [Deltaproteobacteria bacterium]|nr:hypothetical protein [Deltaproteobacteria bacterium]